MCRSAAGPGDLFATSSTEGRCRLRPATAPVPRASAVGVHDHRRPAASRRADRDHLFRYRSIASNARDRDVHPHGWALHLDVTEPLGDWHRAPLPVTGVLVGSGRSHSAAPLKNAPGQDQSDGPTSLRPRRRLSDTCTPRTFRARRRRPARRCRAEERPSRQSARRFHRRSPLWRAAAPCRWRR
jgi:hypothetical protein